MTLAIAGNSASGYPINKSLRLRSSASATLSKSYAGGAGNTTTFTISMWVKKSVVGSATPQHLFNGGTALNTFIGFSQVATDDISGNLRGAGATNYFFGTGAVFRDPSAWYHIVWAVDTTQATAANRVKVYVNGVLQTLTTANYPTQNLAVLGTGTRFISSTGGGVYYFDGYLAEYNFIDGQALTPSSFGTTNPTTGVWQAAKYTGSYGTTGFYLPFTDNTSTTTLGYDFSGNSNNWTANNVSLTAGVTYDSMQDVPTLTSATVANYCTLNPLNAANAPLYADLRMTGVNSAGWYSSTGTIGVSSGKYYWEVYVTLQNNSVNGGHIGAAQSTLAPLAVGNYPGQTTSSIGYRFDGSVYKGSGSQAYGTSWTQGATIGVALDMTAGTITFYNNNVSQGVALSGMTGTWVPMIGVNNGNGTAGDNTLDINFGQRPFTYTPPTGYVALNTYNLPNSTILAGNKYMDATLWTGDGSSSRSITNAGSFKPDLVWGKSRSGTFNNYEYDSVRGAGKFLQTNLTDAEGDFGSIGLTSFNSNGFSIGNGGSINQNGTTYVGWQWQAGQGTTSTNTNGSITSTVSVNPTAGFSIVTYTGTGANATVGHGLGVAPKLIIVKNRISTTNGWPVYHGSLAATQRLVLNLTDAVGTDATTWNNTAPTSSVFSVGTSGASNGSTQGMVAYCWTPIAGFSSFGSYTGNGANDGPFIYTGFRPKFVMFKDATNTSAWNIFDTSRDAYNVASQYLQANTSIAEGTSASCDILSNGFKVRNASNYINTSGDTYIYAAFAENPFKNALAR